MPSCSDHRVPVAIAIVVACVLVAAPYASLACSCTGLLGGRAASFTAPLPEGERQIRAAWQDYSVIFVGRVVAVVDDRTLEACKRRGAIDTRRSAKHSCGSVSVHFVVPEVFRGRIKRNTTVRTERDTGACGYPFLLGRNYLVYGSQLEDGEIRVGLCSRTHELDNECADVVTLRRLVGKPRGCGACEVGDGETDAWAGFVFTLLAVATLAQRRARRRLDDLAPGRDTRDLSVQAAPGYGARHGEESMDRGARALSDAPGG